MSTPIQQLAKEIEGLFQKNPDNLHDELQKIMTAYASQNTDYTPYVHFNDIHYTRNLVHATDKFELIVLCWKKGQGSRIHSHTNSHCWMSTLDGKIEEFRYLPNIAVPIKEISFPGPCPELRQISHHVTTRGDFSYISDEIGLHRVKAHDEADSITLHLYSPPITEARILEPETGKTSTRIPGYYSLYGKRPQTA